MISANIEKEIKQKNKVFLGLTMRQLLVGIVCVVVAVILGCVLSFEVAIYPDAVIAVNKSVQSRSGFFVVLKIKTFVSRRFVYLRKQAHLIKYPISIIAVFRKLLLKLFDRSENHLFWYFLFFKTVGNSMNVRHSRAGRSYYRHSVVRV